MKLSENTLAILNNFKNLNNSILFYPGNEIKNLSSDTSVYMTATIEETIPRKFALFSLNELLQIVRVIKDADIDFREDHLFISNGQNSAVFRYASTEVVNDIYQKKISLNGAPAFEIDLPSEQVKNLFKMAGYLDMKDLKIVPGDKGQIVLYDAKGSHTHTYTIETNTPIDIPAPIGFNISTLSMLEIGYKLSYHPERKMVRFSGTEFNVKYHVSCPFQVAS